MAKPIPKSHRVTVTATERVTANMQRITLQGEEIGHITADDAGNYIKLMFNPQGGTDLKQLAEGERPVLRTYTIRSVDTENTAIEVDFVAHLSPDHEPGVAASWAMQAKVGDTISIGGPGKMQAMYTDADWYLMVADMTALPACSVKASQLPSDAKGYMVVSLMSEADKQALNVPEGIEVIWLPPQQSLVETVKNLPWLEGNVSTWSACEFEDMRQLRKYFRVQKQVARDHSYISSYWKRGVSEDRHKVIKKAEAEKDAAQSL
ncbi:siderophore-interacting protein [Reinekea marinisedimentorum]|uniref:NADPH-dependent ferric siderophore reductase n=1 Tax=Reinekea marinisedimentorum TaxID=230495 RepID=A0A4V2UK92_9GAMM|nr:siderophore-interacting protein [Reinekea marinisedimentorum]TCS43322.1 NADPH-dependent ferric siderophore reductase [Reinekea marinisedimentorum]